MKAIAQDQAIFNTMLALFILLCIGAPVGTVIYLMRKYIRRALDGVDGITDVHELRIGLGYIVIIFFMGIFLFMIITSSALGWQYDGAIYLYVFLVIVGAEATTIVNILDKIKIGRK